MKKSETGIRIGLILTESEADALRTVLDWVSEVHSDNAICNPVVESAFDDLESARARLGDGLENVRRGSNDPGRFHDTSRAREKALKILELIEGLTPLDAIMEIAGRRDQVLALDRTLRIGLSEGSSIWAKWNALIRVYLKEDPEALSRAAKKTPRLRTIGPQPDRGVISTLEVLLSEARDSEIQGLAYIAIRPGAEPETGAVGSDLPSLQLLGAVTMLQHQMSILSCGLPEYEEIPE